MALSLELIKRTDPRILKDMAVHYSQPKGFVGRNICYAIIFDGVCYGAIVGGSATLHLVGRDDFFGLTSGTKAQTLNQIVNNIFYHVEKHDGRYPSRNFVPRVLAAFRVQVAIDWEQKYGNLVLGFESLVELPRTGEAYVRDGWTEVGITKGFTCKRTAGKGTDSWSGRRVWDTKNLRPKRVFVRHNLKREGNVMTYGCNKCCRYIEALNKPKKCPHCESKNVRELTEGDLK